MMTRHTRRLRVAALLLVLVLLPSIRVEAAAAERPSFLIVLVDDLRFDDLGCNGHSFSRTPHADRLAAEGVNFVNAFATTPLCSPSRASLLTGLHTAAHGITDNTERSPASHKLDTFPRRLREAGYRTGYVGKWHMGNDDSARPGFDRWVCLKGQGDSNDPEVNVDGKRSKETGYVTDVLTRHAVDFVRQHASPDGPPLLLYVAHKALHPQTQQGPDGKLSDPAADNFIPAERHRALFADEPLPRRPNYAKPPEGKPALQQQIPGLKPLGAETVSSDKSIRDRLRMLAAVDESTGAIVDALRETGRLDDTVVVFTSDHGYFYGEHGLSTERRLAYEESMRIPLIVRYPALVKSPRRVQQTVLTLDLAPTLLELGKAEAPAKLHGRSLVPLLAGGEAAKAFPPSRDVLVQYWTDTVFPRVRNMGYDALRADGWKFIRYRELEGADELYDLKADPYEIHNRVADPAAQATLGELRKRLDAAVDAAR